MHQWQSGEYLGSKVLFLTSAGREYSITGQRHQPEHSHVVARVAEGEEIISIAFTHCELTHVLVRSAASNVREWRRAVLVGMPSAAEDAADELLHPAYGGLDDDFSNPEVTLAEAEPSEAGSFTTGALDGVHGIVDLDDIGESVELLGASSFISDDGHDPEGGIVEGGLVLAEQEVLELATSSSHRSSPELQSVRSSSAGSMSSAVSSSSSES